MLTGHVSRDLKEAPGNKPFRYLRESVPGKRTADVLARGKRQFGKLQE